MSEDTFELIEKAKNGDNEAFVALTECYSPLISYLTDKFSKTNTDRSIIFDDFRQEANIAFSKAVETYKQGKVTFGLYAKICITNRLISLTRKTKKQKKVKSAEKEKHFSSKGRDISRLSLSEMRENLGLSDFENKVLELYLQNRSYREIAGELGKSEKSVDNALFRVKTKMKKSL